MSSTGRQSLLILFFSWCWFLLSESNIFPVLLIPSPPAVINGFYNAFLQDKLIIDFIFTIGRMIVGLTCGIMIGIILGLLIGSCSITKEIIVWVDFLRSIPGVALFPIFMLAFGLGETAKISLVIFATSLVMIVNTIYGIKNTNPTRLMIAKTLNFSKIQTISKIVFMESLPFISAGIRQAISYSLIMVIVSEMFMGTRYGLGKKIIDYYLTYNTNKMYAIIILTGLIGYLSNRLYIYFETKKIHWVGK